jgi:hypothetical protein
LPTFHDLEALSRVRINDNVGTTCGHEIQELIPLVEGTNKRMETYIAEELVFGPWLLA